MLRYVWDEGGSLTTDGPDGRWTDPSGDIQIELSSLDRVLFPRDGYTKRDLICYYSNIASVMLPYLSGRPITMMRHPRGIDSPGFIQKSAPQGSPSWLSHRRMRKKSGSVDHVLCEKPADLVYLANLSCITPHIWLSRVDAPHHPDRLILDMDPWGEDFSVVVDAALSAREILKEDGLDSFVMTTGSRGLHVVAPLERSAVHDEVRSFALAVGKEMAERDGRFTTDRRTAERGERLLVDTFRNAYAQTGVAPYAARAKDGAPVAAPLRWEELNDPSIGPRRFNIRNVWERLEDDPWRNIGARPGRLPEG